ncbi:MAG: type II secretion system F family protein [Planctomycetaceae bacterium]|nr:type II secretion system F family protein [Planctomycetaceae bacterium]
MAVPATRGITLDDLVALNDEMIALVRSGVPLERGLLALGTDLPGRLGTLATSLGHRLESGESLADTLDESGTGFPRAYRAVVAAGIRSGKLSSALEGISTAARRASEVRRVMIVSLVYPIVVLMVASYMFLFTALKTAPVVTHVYEWLHIERPPWYALIDQVTRLGPQMIIGFWVFTVIVGGIWLYRSSRANAISDRGLRGLPTVARVLHVGRMATFADVLAMMVDQQVALDEAVVLAAEASGDRILVKASGTIAERIRTGERMTSLPAGFPPLLGWLLNASTQREHLAKSLRQTADSYRRRALNMGNWLTIYLPIILSAGVGGTIAMLYVLIVMAPFCNLLYQLSLP